MCPRRYYPVKLREYVKEFNKEIDESTLSLLEGLLTLDPTKRLTAAKSLEHPYFSSQPLATPLDKMPKIDREYHETLL